LPPSSGPLALTAAPADLDGRIALLRGAAIPVLAGTAAALEALRPHEETIDARHLAELVSGDPLMTLKLSCTQQPAAHAARPPMPRPSRRRW
jgi:hypothetical protein